MSKKNLPPDMERIAYKTFLNKDGFHELAAIGVEIEETHGFITISDCSTKINLNLDFFDLDDYENTFYKIKQLVKTLRLVEMHMICQPRYRFLKNQKTEKS